MGQDFSNFNFGGSSGFVIIIFAVIFLFIAIYVAYKILNSYLKDKKKFGWIYELAKSRDFSKSQIQDLKEVSEENQIKNLDQLYRVLHSVKMLSSTRRKLLFDPKEKPKSTEGTKRPVSSR